MSFIRHGQDGTYVDIPCGSNYYIYGNGETIEGWNPAEFAALIGSVVDELPDSAFAEQPREMVRDAFSEHFGGWDAEYRGGIAPPERAEIFCQCVDKRLDVLTLTDTLHESVTTWADSFNALRECTYCGTEFRPYVYTDDTAYVCSSDECDLKHDAEMYEVSVEVVRRSEMITNQVGFDEGWNFLATRSPRDDITP